MRAMDGSFWLRAFPSPRYAAWRRRIAWLSRRLRWDARGLEHVPPSGPVILAMNHTGWEEILVATLMLDRPLAYLGIRDVAWLDRPAAQRRVFASTYGLSWGLTRRMLFRGFGRLVGRWLRGVLAAGGYVPVGVAIPGFPPKLGRNGLDLAVARLAEGHPLLVFPQGGYRRDGEVIPFKPGVGLLVAACARAGLRVPVLPVAQWTARCISLTLGNRFVPRVRIGPPLFWDDAPGTSTRERAEHFTALLQARVQELLAPIHPATYAR